MSNEPERELTLEEYAYALGQNAVLNTLVGMETDPVKQSRTQIRLLAEHIIERTETMHLDELKRTEKRLMRAYRELPT